MVIDIPDESPDRKVFTLTLALVTAAGILDDRRQLFLAQAEQARALLAHLAQMHECRGDFETAASSLALVRDSLAGSGGSVELVPARATRETKGEVVASQALSLGGGSFELLYLRDGGRVRELGRAGGWRGAVGSQRREGRLTVTRRPVPVY